MTAREHLPVQLACRVLHVAESGYHAWRDRPPSNRLVRHAWLTEAIVGIRTASRGTYGSRRVHAELRLGLSIHVSHGTVELLMQRAGLHGLPGNRRPRTRHVTPSVADLVERNFTVTPGTSYGLPTSRAPHAGGQGGLHGRETKQLDCTQLGTGSPGRVRFRET
ncbi:MAG: transposase [Streptomyces sp.]|nr:transposase [Streptomyces sp.]